jgi:hypothetical protein
MSGVHSGLEKFQCLAICLDDFFRGKALEALEAPIAEEWRSLGHKLVFLVAAVLAPFDLIDSTVRRHNPTVRTQAAIISGPMGIDDIDLSPLVATGIRAIVPILCLLPATVKILYIVKFCKATTVGANEYERVRKKTDSAGLIEDKPSLVNARLILVV